MYTCVYRCVGCLCDNVSGSYATGPSRIQVAPISILVVSEGSSGKRYLKTWSQLVFSLDVLHFWPVMRDFQKSCVSTVPRVVSGWTGVRREDTDWEEGCRQEGYIPHLRPRCVSSPTGVRGRGTGVTSGRRDDPWRPKSLEGTLGVGRWYGPRRQNSTKRLEARDWGSVGEGVGGCDHNSP